MTSPRGLSKNRVMKWLALVAVLLVGCGGGGEAQAKVEAGLQQYFSRLSPEDTAFPQGAGPPRVKDNSCVKLGPAALRPPFPRVLVNGHARSPTTLKGRRVSFWDCAVIFGTYRPMRVAVVVDGTKVVAAMPDTVGNGRVHQAPARTYTG